MLFAISRSSCLPLLLQECFDGHIELETSTRTKVSVQSIQNIPVCYGFVLRDQQCEMHQTLCSTIFFYVVICYSVQSDVAKVEELLAVFLPFFLSSDFRDFYGYTTLVVL